MKGNEMLVRKVRASWLFINKVDDNGNFRVTFEVDKKLDKELWAELDAVADQHNLSLQSDCEWTGSRKEENGKITYTAKCAREFTNKKGETIVRELPIYNEKAQLLKPEELFDVANGALINLVVEPYYAKHKNKKGVMFGLRSVQLIEYKEYMGENPYEDETGENPYSNENEENPYANESGDDYEDDKPPFETKESNTLTKRGPKKRSDEDDELFEK